MQSHLKGLDKILEEFRSKQFYLNYIPIHPTNLKEDIWNAAQRLL
jgi:hypothetical protein